MMLLAQPTNDLRKLLVKAILASPFGLKWSVQGLGMMRTYLSDAVRLHIWDSRLKVPNVSPIHDHPWHLTSYIVAGEMRQNRFVHTPHCPFSLGDLEMEGKALEVLSTARIKCGEGAVTVTDQTKVTMIRLRDERYFAGQSYQQQKSEIHESYPTDGTITLVTREFTGDRDHARVFWRGDGPWVDAEPRPATHAEVRWVTETALKLLEKENG